MQIHCLTPDHTMRRMVEAFKEHNLTEDAIEELFRVLSAAPTPTQAAVPTNETVNPPNDEAKFRKNKRKK